MQWKRDLLNEKNPLRPELGLVRIIFLSKDPGQARVGPV